MAPATDLNDKTNRKIEVEYPDFAPWPLAVRETFEARPPKVNFFRMLG